MHPPPAEGSGIIVWAEEEAAGVDNPQAAEIPTRSKTMAPGM